MCLQNSPGYTRSVNNSHMPQFCSTFWKYIVITSLHFCLGLVFFFTEKVNLSQTNLFYMSNILTLSQKKKPVIEGNIFCNLYMPMSACLQKNQFSIIEQIEAGSGYVIFNRPDVAGSVLQLDGVGPVDNRPSTDQLHHFVQFFLTVNFFVFFFLLQNLFKTIFFDM